jgi:hypothetical protein
MWRVQRARWSRASIAAVDPPRRGGDSLDGTEADVAGSEHPRDAGLEPRGRAAGGEVAAGEDEAVPVQGERGRERAGMRSRADEHEQPIGFGSLPFRRHR